MTSNLLKFLSLTFFIVGFYNPAEAQISKSQREIFTSKILPILSDKCFACHGPDTKDPDMLRLDSFEAATKDRGGYFALKPGKLDESELVKRIHSKDDPMPPADAEKQLTEEERKLFEQWIKLGGKYAKHWAFVSPWITMTKSSRTDFHLPTNIAIDRYVADVMKGRDIDFAPQADLATLARRASLVLTGLPPKPERIEALLKDKRDDAYERFVDELLADKKYGEHRARYWLDAVRYGDTHGLHLDNRRGIYPYRDWVVRAYNENLPLDDFIKWQLAGDLLPNPTMEQLIATGFVRMNPSTSEGGVIPDEFQAKNNFDRVETLGTVLLGMTLTCARCHTHKYDPIPQTEYYQMLAFFNSTAEGPLDGNSYTYGPTLKVPKDQDRWREWSRLESASQQLLKSVDKIADGQEQQLDEYVAAAKPAKFSNWNMTLPVPADQTTLEEIELKPVKGLPGGIKTTLPDPKQAVWITFDIESEIAQSIWMTYTGGVASRVNLNGEDQIQITAAEKDGQVFNTLMLETKPGKNPIHLKLAGSTVKPQIEIRLLDVRDAFEKKKEWSNCTTEEKLLVLSDKQSPLSISYDVQHSAMEFVSQRDQAEADFTTTLIAKELPKPRDTFLLKRGEYNMPTGEPLQPGVFSVMGFENEYKPKNRLGLANWLTSQGHPLVARVLVNRLWQQVFGVGLVRTPEDFGLQGQQPTHPALLDWLAIELYRSGWDTKHMLRLMVTSRTFKQSSRWRDNVNDPENRLFARGPSYRLDAEVLRDVALWSSNMLDPHMGGEGVKPYQPAGMWAALAHPASNTKKYVRDNGDLLYRRSLYVYWKRTSPHPMMTLFDAPDRESSCVRRSRTTTSLQSLGLLNETQRVELSRKLAERLLKERKTDADRLDRLFMLLASREPSKVEKDVCLSLLKQAHERYKKSPEDAEAILKTGEATTDKNLKPADVAAWTQVTSTVLASDIAILLY